MMLKKLIKHKGFTLVEMAIVLVIFGLILSALLLPLRVQREQAALAQTVNTLENAKQALLGFAQANGRLPCPAIAGSAVASPNVSGACSVQLGFLPAATLGMQPTNADGFAVDAWNNPIMYAVTQSNKGGAPTPDYTTNDEPEPPLDVGDGMNVVGIQALSSPPNENLRVCRDIAGTTVNRCSTGPSETNFLIDNAVAVIYSTGATGALDVGSANEAANPRIPTNPKMVFVSSEPSSSAAPNEFDHIFTWISPYVLYNAMIQAGQLH